MSRLQSTVQPCSIRELHADAPQFCSLLNVRHPQRNPITLRNHTAKSTQGVEGDEARSSSTAREHPVLYVFKVCILYS